MRPIFCRLFVYIARDYYTFNPSIIYTADHAYLNSCKIRLRLFTSPKNKKHKKSYLHFR